MNLLKTPHIHSLMGPILITGHTGFKGTWMTLLLEKLGIDVVGYSLPPEKDSLFDRANRTGAIVEKFADIRDFKEVGDFIHKYKPSAIFHMAAQPLVLESYHIPRETFDVNVMGTVNLLDSAFACESVEAIVVITTDKVYRNDNSGRAFIESDPLEGKDPYSARKVGTEAAVAAWQQIAKISGGPKVISTRAGNVIGGGDWSKHRIMPQLVRNLLKHEPIQIQNPNSTRPWMHVLDSLHGYLLVLDAVLKGEIIEAINFGPTEFGLSVKDLVEFSILGWTEPCDISFPIIQSTQCLEAIHLQLDSTMARTRSGLKWKPYWSQQEAGQATLIWWDRVINKSLNAVEACHLDMEALESRIQLG